jgi:hypothetical protein
MQTAARARKLIRWLCCLKYCLQKLIFIMQGFIHMTYAVIHWIGSFVQKMYIYAICCRQPLSLKARQWGFKFIFPNPLNAFTIMHCPKPCSK